MNARDVPAISESVILQFITSETASTDAHHPKENVTVGRAPNEKIEDAPISNLLY